MPAALKFVIKMLIRLQNAYEPAQWKDAVVFAASTLHFLNVNNLLHRGGWRSDSQTALWFGKSAGTLRWKQDTYHQGVRIFDSNQFTIAQNIDGIFAFMLTPQANVPVDTVNRLWAEYDQMTQPEVPVKRIHIKRINVEAELEKLVYQASFRTLSH